MVEVFKHVDKFFASLTNYLTYNYIFIIFVGLFLFTAFCVLIFTSRSYEARLIKTVDKFNSYFIDNPQINEDNLVSFNKRMKHKKVPKQLRKHWQQYVLYREHKASHYMSFENCVSKPIKNSTYTRDVKLMGTLAWIFSLCSLVLNCYYCFEITDIGKALSSILLTPVLILVLNYIIQIFLNLRHNAIVSDLFQNYQYFEVNIDKATETLPEYVDYEVLFDRNEIKKGIPILYSFLQKRAEEEQRQLERARLKNVEHEKFNFDDQGIAASLVLERAMQEAENYIAERKKYTQDIGQINADITQEDINYREVTKEYNRQMQVSKETFANFKAQLEEVTSTIEANYLKKQQQQELDRQRNLERDFDAATEKHKKIIDSYQAELDTIDKFIAQSRKNLEDAMKSEFETYSSKVYDEANKIVEQRMEDKFSKSKDSIVELEEKLVSKEQELEKSYNNNQKLSEQLDKLLSENRTLIEVGRKNKKFRREIMDISEGYDQTALENIKKLIDENYDPTRATQLYDENEDPNSESGDAGMLVDDQLEYDENWQEDGEYDQEYYEEDDYDYVDGENAQQYYDDNYQYEDTDQQYEDLNEFEYQDQPESQDLNQPVYEEYQDVNQGYEEHKNDNQQINQAEEPKDQSQKNFDITEDEDYYDQINNQPSFNNDQPVAEEYKPEQSYNETVQGKEELFDENDLSDLENNEKEVDESLVTEVLNTSEAEKFEADETENVSTTQTDDSIHDKSVAKRGRPRKVVDTEEVKVEKKKPGRPRKEKSLDLNKPKRGRGRPRKVKNSNNEEISKEVKRGPGRPRKETKETGAETLNVKRGRGRPKKVVSNEEQEEKRGRGRPKKEEVNNIKNIDDYLKELDAAIAAENAKLEKTQQELEKEARLKRKK